MNAAADGERNAVRGYRWQYIQLAARVFDTLLDETFVSLRLVDPAVGKVDGLVLVTTSGTTGHQYKSEGDPGTLNLADLLRPVHRRGQEQPSLMRELAVGWQALRDASGDSRVELVTNRRASVHDRLGEPGDPDRPDPDHLAAFLTTVAEPLRTRKLTLAEVPSGWQPALRKIHADTGLDHGTFAQFMAALTIRVHQGNPLAGVHRRRHADIRALADHLFETVANSTDVVELGRDTLLAELGWTNRTTSPRHPGRTGRRAVRSRRRGSSVPVIVRNTTEATVYSAEVTGIARDAAGGLLATGSSQGLDPAVLQPGDWSIGHVYFGFDFLTGEETFEFAVTGETDPSSSAASLISPSPRPCSSRAS